jgi:hypothetical protein
MNQQTYWSQEIKKNPKWETNKNQDEIIFDFKPNWMIKFSGRVNKKKRKESKFKLCVYICPTMHISHFKFSVELVFMQPEYK